MASLNSSTSKQKFSFSRANRFGSIKLNTDITQYDLKSQFEKSPNTNKTFNSARRFTYYSSAEKE